MAALLGTLAAIAIPGAVVVARSTAGVRILDAVWAIPFALVLGVAALFAARGARTRRRVTLERAGGARRLRAGVILAVAGLCFAASGLIAVGFYELLLRLEG